MQSFKPELIVINPEDIILKSSLHLKSLPTNYPQVDSNLIIPDVQFLWSSLSILSFIPSHYV